jgi:hypothetical protein
VSGELARSVDSFIGRDSADSFIGVSYL